MAQLQRVTIATPQLQNQMITLSPEQQHYLSHVLRLPLGGQFIAMTGQGQCWRVQLVKAEGSQSQQWQGQILETLTDQTELPIAVTLLMALPKGNGFDEVVRQATELGVSCIAPVISARTLLQPSPQKIDRWQRIAQEAAEQSERQIVPTILPPQSLSDRWHEDCISPQGQSGQRYICVTRKAVPSLLNCLSYGRKATSPEVSASVVIATGPEGGWTDSEVEQAIACGYQPVSLGSRILRAVTAPIAALSLISAVFDFDS